MSEKQKEDSDLADLQAASIAVSVSVIVFFIVYWAFQIQTTLELLELAYG